MNHGGVHEKGSLNLMEIINNVKNSDETSKVGALCIFVGLVRGKAGKDKSVERLELEAHEEQANLTLNRICSELCRTSGIIDVQIHHMLGEFESGEELVYVLVAGKHRNEVYPVLKKAVERFKKEAPIFKKEYVKSKNGRLVSYWVSEKRS